MAAWMTSRITMRASRAWVSAPISTSLGMPVSLVSSCSAVTNSRVPATLKSMSPKASSAPRMSVRVTNSPPSEIRPMAMPPTGAVADLPPLGTAHEAGLPGGERREVVVVHVALAVLGVEGVDDLLHADHAEGGDVEHLGLAALEQAGAVRPWQDADLGRERPDVARPAPVDALGLLDDPLAHQLLVEAAEGGRDLALAAGVGLAELAAGRLGGLRLEGVEALLPLGLVGDGDRLAHGRLGDAPDDPGDVLGVVLEQGKLAGLRAGLTHQLELELAGGGDVRLGELQGQAEGLLGRLGRAALLHQPHGVLGGLGLDHQDVDPAALVLAAGHHHVEGALLHLGVGRVDDPVGAAAAEAYRADRPAEGDAGELHRGGGAVDGADVGVALHVGGQDGGDHVDLVAHALGERGPQRPVDQAGGEDGRLRRPPLTAEEAAGDLAGGVHALLHVHGEREEVELLLGLLAGGRGDQHLGLAQAGDHGAACQPGQLAGLQQHVPAADRALHTMYCHECLFSSLPLMRRPLAGGGTAIGGSDRRSPGRACGPLVAGPRERGRALPVLSRKAWELLLPGLTTDNWHGTGPRSSVALHGC